MLNIQRIWRIGLLLLLVGIGSCDNEDNNEPLSYDLEAELTWDQAVNMDLWIIEPTGKGSGHGDPGVTAFNTGDNLCGFGDACDPAVCTDLPCGTPERIIIPYNTALPDTTEPLYVYEIGISNWSDADVTMLLTIRTPAMSRSFTCWIDGPRVSYAAQVAFPEGRIEAGIGSFLAVYCQEGPNP